MYGFQETEYGVVFYGFARDRIFIFTFYRNSLDVDGIFNSGRRPAVDHRRTMKNEIRGFAISCPRTENVYFHMSRVQIA